MKLTTFLLIIALVQASAKGYSQITLHEKNASFEKVMQSIKKQSGFTFFYDENVKPGLITVDVTNVSVSEALNKCFLNLPVTYQIVDNNILLKVKESIAVNNVNANKSVIISGKVSDEQGNPLVGATVTIQGTNTVGITDGKGNYKISAEPGQTLVFTYVGYTSQTYIVKHQRSVDITLIAQANVLQEIVVNKGYYTEKQMYSTGDVSSVSGIDIQKAGINNPIIALEGRVPGVYIAETSGLPGSTFSLLLRGKNSFLQGNDPLYIIDGVPFDPQSMSKVVSAAGAISPFSALNVADIEQIDVLKDADATAIYGSRGANGVILITTKKGKPGRTAVNINISNSYSEYPHFVKLLNTQQYLMMRDEAFANDNATPTASDPDVNGDWNKNSYTDWQRTLLGGTAQTTNAQGTISGGDKNTQFSINGGYRKQGLIYTNSTQNDQNASVRASLTHTNDNKKLIISLTVGYTNDNNKLPQTDLTNYIKLAPDAPALYKADGSLNWQNGTFSNPLAALQSTTQSISSNLLSNLTLTYHLLTGLDLKASTGYNSIELNEQNIEPTAYFDPGYFTTGSLQNQVGISSGKSWILEPQIQYDHYLWKGKLQALAGTTLQDKTNYGTSFTAIGFANDEEIQNYSSATTKIFNPQIYSQYHYTAAYARINYNLEDKYIVNLTGRRDGSSRFGPGKQFGNFGAIGAAWLFSKESWFKDISWLSFGKLRTSYGITGNDQIGDYQFYNTYYSSNVYGNGTTVIPGGLSNSTLAWEINKKAEVGLELGFLSDRINLSISYYRNRSGNQLVRYLLPSIAGFTTVTANLPAVVQNTGLEIALSTQNVKSKDFSWNTSFNITVPRNKWISFADLAETPYANQVFIGKSLFVTNQYRYLGIDPLTGVYTYQDINKDNQINQSDYTQDKEISQKFYGGFSNTFRWKSLQLDVFFQYVKQTGKSFLSAFNVPGEENSNEPISVLNRWQYPGDQTNIQKFTQYGGSPASIAYNNYYISYGDNNIVNTSFIRLKSLSLSYSIPKKWMNPIGVQDAQLYIQGQNLFTLTPYVGPDPETGGTILPPLRTISLGLRITL